MAKERYAGSAAEQLWGRLASMDFISRGILFAATLLLSFFPFLIVVNALAGRSATTGLAPAPSPGQPGCSSSWAGSPRRRRSRNCMSAFDLDRRGAGGPVLLAVIGLVVFTGFWWFTMWFLLAGRVAWRVLFPATVATAVFWLVMEAVFSVIFSGMVISDNQRYGPIGVVFALMSWLIAIGVVIILGAVTGVVWHERNLSFRAAFKKARPAGPHQ